MARKLALVLATGVVAGLVIGLVLGGGVGSAAGGKPPQTIVYVDKTITSHNVDLGQKGFTPGDEFVGHDDLLQNGKVVGKLAVMCVATDVDKAHHTATNLCTAVARFAGGQLDLAARLVFSNNTNSFKVGVTGGTDAYRNASGFAVVKSIKNNVSRLTLYLST